jgi:hypothetical protein
VFFFPCGIPAYLSSGSRGWVESRKIWNAKISIIKRNVRISPISMALLGNRDASSQERNTLRDKVTDAGSVGYGNERDHKTHTSSNIHCLGKPSHV